MKRKKKVSNNVYILDILTADEKNVTLLAVVRLSHPQLVERRGVVDTFRHSETTRPRDDLIAIQNNQLGIAFTLFKTDLLVGR